MKTKKMSLANIKDKLSRTEMKKIMAGSGGGGCPNFELGCSSTSECRLVNAGDCYNGCCSN